MATAMFSPRFIRFGIYEADLPSGELERCAETETSAGSRFRCWPFCWSTPAKW